MCTDIFGGLFDFDMDGKTDSFELALGLNMVMEDEAECELAAAGLDRFDPEQMDDDERREALEDAGLDPDDYL